MSTQNHTSNQDDNFRETGKFKPLPDSSQLLPDQNHKFSLKVVIVRPFPASHSIKTSKHLQQQSKWWRLYFQEPLSSYDQDSLTRTVQKCFTILVTNNQLQQAKSIDIFLNVNGVLIQRIKNDTDYYHMSNLDYNCLVACLKVDNKAKDVNYRIECFQVEPEKNAKDQKEFVQQVYIKMRDELSSFYLLSKNNKLFLVKDRIKQLPFLELSDQHLDESISDVPKNIIIIKNLSPRIISIKFLEQTYFKNNEPLQITIKNSEIYAIVLYRINRLRYQKYKIEDSESKEWHSFDEKLKSDHKKQSKTTPEKLKSVGKLAGGPNANKISNQSTNFVQEQHQSPQSKKINPKTNMYVQPKNLKISQRIMTNPKESTLVPSELDYPVSVKDDKQKQCSYYDDFQNLLYEDGGEEKQLSLNDSFEEFEKKENNLKNLEIMAQLNQRKVKQQQEQNTLNALKERMVYLMSEEKEWIDKNFKLKVEIKRIQKKEINSQQNKEIEEVRAKINELKKYQKGLMEELSSIRFQNNIEIIVFGEPGPQKSTESNREKEDKKIFHSINGFSPTKKQSEPLACSVRSNNDYTFILPNSSQSPTAQSKAQKPAPFKHSYIPFKPNLNSYPQKKEHPSQLSAYSAVAATQSFIEPQHQRNVNYPISKTHCQNGYNLSFLDVGQRLSSKNTPDSIASVLTNPQHLKLSPQNSQKKIPLPQSFNSKT